MLPILVSASLLIPSDPPAAHEAANPLYRELRETGLAVGSDTKAKLPAPIVPDGLDAAGQKKAITAFIASDYSWAEFTRNSVVAPYISRTGKTIPSDPKAPAQSVDIGFIVHGDFAATDDAKFLDQLLASGRKEEGGKPITPADLAKRNITLGDHEKIGYVEFDILDTVRLSVAGHVVWSRTSESVLAAARIDPRFRNDAVFPNEWRSLTQQGGKRNPGPPHLYDGAGFYLKITKLAEPKEAVFVEQHVVFPEPVGWFNGQNLLRSKLPTVVQDNVKTMRSKWMARDGKK